MPVFRRTLRTLRWQIGGYGIGLVLWAALVAVLYPTMGESYGQLQLPEAYREMFGLSGANLGDFRTFVSVEFFQWVPLVIAIYAITAATGTLAGEEGRGALEVLLAQPVSRARLFGEKVAALAVGAVLITALAAAGLVVTVAFIDTGGEITVAQLGAAVFASLPLIALTGSLALLVAAVAPSRGTAAAVVTAIVVATWLANGLGGLSSQTAWLKYVSGFYYADVQTLLTSGVTAWHQVVVIGVAAAQTALALAAFQRREIEVGRWQLGALLPAGAVRDRRGRAPA